MPLLRFLSGCVAIAQVNHIIVRDDVAEGHLNGIGHRGGYRSRYRRQHQNTGINSAKSLRFHTHMSFPRFTKASAYSTPSHLTGEGTPCSEWTWDISKPKSPH